MQDNVYELHQPTPGCQMEEARVKGLSGQSVMLQTATGLEKARQAVSCLVQPREDDRVLISRTPSATYVLAILERLGPDSSATTLAFNGPLTVTSPEAVNITSQSANLVNQQTRVTSTDVSLLARRLSSSSDEIVSHSRSVRVISKAFDMVAERVTRHARHLLSRVQEHEVRQSGDLTEQTTRTHLQQSRQTVVDARKDLRMNAERIHMG